MAVCRGWESAPRVEMQGIHTSLRDIYGRAFWWAACFHPAPPPGSVWHSSASPPSGAPQVVVVAEVGVTTDRYLLELVLVQSQERLTPAGASNRSGGNSSAAAATADGRSRGGCRK